MFKGASQNVGRSPRKKAKKSSSAIESNDDRSASILFGKSDKTSMETRMNTYKSIWAATQKKSEVSVYVF